MLFFVLQGSYECKGYAFVEFFSTEYAEHFTKSFTGSIGDQNGPQLIVEGRAVTMDYATPRSDLDHCNSTTSESGRRGDMSSKSDWLCDTVCDIILLSKLQFPSLIPYCECSVGVRTLLAETNAIAAQH